MALSHAIPADDLLLARLAAAKLAKLVRGLFTVGLAALETDRPLDFLHGRERPPLAFVEVLACAGLFRREAEALADSVREIHGGLAALASPPIQRDAAERLADA